MKHSVERLLLSARGADGDLLREWLCDDELIGRPPDGIFLLEIGGSFPDADGNNALALLNKCGLPLKSGAAIFVYSDQIQSPEYIRFEVSISPVHHVKAISIFPAKWHVNGWKAHNPVHFYHVDGELHFGADNVMKFIDDAIDEKYISDMLAKAVTYIVYTMFYEQETRTFSAARRAPAAKVGWSGVRYTIANLNRPKYVDQTRHLGGTHASPALHWVRGHLRVIKSMVKFIAPHQRGKASRGIVIKDWVREAGLSTNQANGGLGA